MLRKIERFDEDLIPYSTLVICPDGVRREFLNFDDEGDLIIAAPELNGKSGEVVYRASDCQLKT
jgi:hypothetical protein